MRGLWDEGVVGPTPAPRVPSASGSGSLQEDRARRLIRGAVEDLERGEAARASAALEGVLRSDPKRAEAHWYLALLARQRGRYDSADVHLRAFLAAAVALIFSMTSCFFSSSHGRIIVDRKLRLPPSLVNTLMPR